MLCVGNLWSKNGKSEYHSIWYPVLCKFTIMRKQLVSFQYSISTYNFSFARCFTLFSYIYLGRCKEKRLMSISYCKHKVNLYSTQAEILWIFSKNVNLSLTSFVQKIVNLCSQPFLAAEVVGTYEAGLNHLLSSCQYQLPATKKILYTP